MRNNYFQKFRYCLYKKEILPLIVREKDLNGSSLDEIIELMKPVPYEQIAPKLPPDFARTTKFILDPRNYNNSP